MMYFVLSNRLGRVEAIWGKDLEIANAVEVVLVVVVWGFDDGGVAIADVLNGSEG